MKTLQMFAKAKHADAVSVLLNPDQRIGKGETIDVAFRLISLELSCDLGSYYLHTITNAFDHPVPVVALIGDCLATDNKVAQTLRDDKSNADTVIVYAAHHQQLTEQLLDQIDELFLAGEGKEFLITKCTVFKLEKGTSS